MGCPSCGKSLIEFNQSIPAKNMSWLESCAIGRVREGFNLSEVEEGLAKAGSIDCELCLLGGISTLLKFQSLRELEGFLVKFDHLGFVWFDIMW